MKIAYFSSLTYSNNNEHFFTHDYDEIEVFRKRIKVCSLRMKMICLQTMRLAMKNMFKIRRKRNSSIMLPVFWMTYWGTLGIMFLLWSIWMTLDKSLMLFKTQFYLLFQSLESKIFKNQWKLILRFEQSLDIINTWNIVLIISLN